MADQRTPRDYDSRTNKVRPSDKYVPPSVLPIPEPQDGWVFRWVRTSMLDKADLKNVSAKKRDGWEPVKASDHPELQVESDIGSQFTDGVEIGGLLLCKAPLEWVEKRREYYRGLNERQMAAVDQNFMRENDPRMPLLQPERKTRTEFGRG